MNINMELIKNIDILVLRPSDIIERLRHDFDIADLKEFDKYFKFGIRNMILTSSVILFIDYFGNTAILKNRYGRPQI